MRAFVGKCVRPLLAVTLLAALSGCASADDSTGDPSIPTAEAVVPAESTWPDGADEDTPACQDASAATLAIVNDSLHAAAAERGLVETTLPWLSASPDDELGVWTLTGIIENEQTALGSEGGYLAAWATDTDPTAEDFAGAVYTISGVSVGLTTLPPLVPAYVGASDMDDTPPHALACGMQRANLP
jgi:hypothetical protein